MILQNTVFNPSTIRKAYTYDEYLALMSQLVQQKKTTGLQQTDAYVEYTRLNKYRMHRLDKVVSLNYDLQQLAFMISNPQTWYVLTEAWCGDAAQNLPVMAKVAQLNPLITLRLLLRDEHPEIMDAHLTNGGRSIPKLIAQDADGNELFTWGPRPRPLQEMIWEYKKNPTKPYAEFQEDIQRWYNADKTQTVQTELTELLKRVYV